VNHVRGKKEERHDERLHRDQGHQQNKRHRGTEWLLFDEGQVLERVEFHGADHEEGEHEGENQEERPDSLRLDPQLVEEQNGGRDHHRGSRFPNDG